LFLLFLFLHLLLLAFFLVFLATFVSHACSFFAIMTRDGVARNFRIEGSSAKTPRNTTEEWPSRSNQPRSPYGSPPPSSRWRWKIVRDVRAHQHGFITYRVVGAPASSAEADVDLARDVQAPRCPSCAKPAPSPPSSRVIFTIVRAAFPIRLLIRNSGAGPGGHTRGATGRRVMPCERLPQSRHST
jgi:hypothetical protein